MLIILLCRTVRQELRELAKAEAAAAAPADDSDLVAAAQEGMAQMSEEFKRRGAEIYH